MLSKQERRNLVISVVGGLLVTVLVGVFRPLRDFLFGPTPFRPIWAILVLLTAVPVVIYFRRKTRRIEDRLLDVHTEVRGLQTHLQAVSSDVDRRIADIHDAESPAKLPEEPEWESYTSDRFLDVNWKWGWDGTSITNLQPICPKCRLNLHPDTELIGDIGDPELELFKGLACRDPACGFQRPFYARAQTTADLERLAKDQIIRKAREQGFPD
jgi:hypothetical protein